MAVLGDMVNNGSTTPSPLKSLPRSVHTGYGSSHVDVRSIRKYGDRVLCVWGGGQASCKQHASHAAMGGGPCCASEPRPPLFAGYHLTPPGTMQDASVHPVGTHPGKRPRLVLYLLFARKGGCVVPALSPLWVGCGACWAELVSMVVFECSSDSGPLACSPSLQPKRYPACRKYIFKQVPSGRLRAGVGPRVVSGAAA